ncbi:hypothetical protein Tco_0765286 [Tanacetum coccineum]
MLWTSNVRTLKGKIFSFLIADCLSNELLYSVMNNVNTVSRFFKLHDAYTVGQACCLELEAEISKLKHNIQKDDHSEMIKRFYNLEIDHLNLQLKYQNLKERFGINKSQPSQDTPEFDTVFEINKMKTSLQGKNNVIRKLKEKFSQMNKRRSEADRILDFKALDFQNTELTKKVTALQEQNTLFRAENEKVKQHYKELYDSIKITRAKTIEKTASLLTKNEKLKAQLKGRMQCVPMPPIKSKVLSPKILREIVEEARIEKPLDNALENACFYSKRSRELLEYVIGTLEATGKKFTLGEQCPLTRVYNVEGLGHNLFSVGQLYDSDREVAFKKHSCYVRNEDGVDLLKGKDLVRDLPRLKFEKDHLCSACQLGKSKKYTHKPKSENTLTEILHTLHIDLCGLMRV